MLSSLIQMDWIEGANLQVSNIYSACTIGHQKLD